MRSPPPRSRPNPRTQARARVGLISIETNAAQRSPGGSAAGGHPRHHAAPGTPSSPQPRLLASRSNTPRSPQPHHPAPWPSPQPTSPPPPAPHTAPARRCPAPRPGRGESRTSRLLPAHLMEEEGCGSLNPLGAGANREAAFLPSAQEERNNPSFFFLNILKLYFIF